MRGGEPIGPKQLPSHWDHLLSFRRRDKAWEAEGRKGTGGWGQPGDTRATVSTDVLTLQNGRLIVKLNVKGRGIEKNVQGDK